jgi:hypothetical protein
MRLVRQALSWVAGWALTATVIGAGIVIWTLARGGTVQGTLACGGQLDANVYALAIEAGLAALFVVLLYWALGAPAIRWRFIRLAGVIIAAIPISIGIFVGSQTFQLLCMGGPPPL